MKIRKGFVTNSSSSSFIVFFDKVPESVEELKEMMFGSQTHFKGYYSTEVYPTIQIAQTVWEDIQEQSPNDIEKITEAIDVGYIEGSPDYPHVDYSDQEAYHKAWEEYEKDCDEFAKQYIKKILEENKDTSIYTFHYSDDDGVYYSTLEHGGIFDNLKHKKISHH